MNRSQPPSDEQFEAARSIFERKTSGRPAAFVTSRRGLELLGVPPAAIPAGRGPFLVTKSGIEAIEIEEEPLA